MRQQREQRDRGERRRAKPPGNRPDRARAAARRRLGHHRVAGVSESELARGVEQHGAREHHHHERERKRIPGDLLDSIKNLHRGDARDVEDERDAELGEREDEHDRAAREKAGHDERQRDLPKLAEARAA